MPRIDIWDVKAARKKAEDVDCGLPRDFDSLYEWGPTLGKGGFGLVRVVREKATGLEFACKSVAKSLDIPNLSVDKLAQHLDNVKREIKILTRLRGTLSVVRFKGAWEDDDNLHLVMEWCRGGELLHEVGRRPYTEKKVAAYMRSVLHTLAQCHSHRILHRDIKPGNFMLLTEEEDSPLKAIDFGLAVFFEPDKLPRTDLGLEGTPWFMAPETLSSEVYPASDVWAAGVMAYQLLSGYLPFDDPRNPNAPALSVIWKGILTEQPSFRRAAWREASPEAQDFVQTLLNKDHAARPSARDALRHPWLQPGFHEGRAPRPLSATVVQRIQRYAQTSVLKRSILELIAQELLKMLPPTLSPSDSTHGAHAYQAQQAAAAVQAQLHAKERAADEAMADAGDCDAPAAAAVAEGGQPALACQSPSIPIPQAPAPRQQPMPTPFGDAGASAPFPPPLPKPASLPAGGFLAARAGGSAHGGDLFSRVLSGSVHGGRAMARSPSNMQLAALARAAQRRGAATVHGPGEYWRVMRAAMESGHGQAGYLHVAPRSEEERQEQHKVARLSLDTSAHGGAEYRRLREQLADRELKHKAAAAARPTSPLEPLSPQRLPALPADAPRLPPRPFPPTAGGQAAVPFSPQSALEERGRGRSSVLALLAGGGGEAGGVHASASAPGALSATAGEEEGSSRRSKRVSFQAELGGTPEAEAMAAEAAAAAAAAVAAAAPSPGVGLPAGGVGSGPVTNPQDLTALMKRMSFKANRGRVGQEALAEGLRSLGYDLEPSEVATIMSELDLDADGAVAAPEFVASQLDWAQLQQNNRDLWLECARRAFEGLDKDSDGKLQLDSLLAGLRSKLPAAEVDYALEDALMDLGYADADAVDYEGFLSLLHVGSLDSLDTLDQYDSRFAGRACQDGSRHDGSTHGGDAGSLLSALPSVPEEGLPPQLP